MPEFLAFLIRGVCELDWDQNFLKKKSWEKDHFQNCYHGLYGRFKDSEFCYGVGAYCWTKECNVCCYIDMKVMCVVI